jgi:hypothetical protein
MTLSVNDLAAHESSWPRVINPRVEWVRALLKNLNTDCSAEERDFFVTAVHQATAGSDQGLAMADEWCRARSDYPGAETFAAEWRSITGYPAGMDGFSALCEQVDSDGFDSLQICSSTEPGFEPCDYEIVPNPDQQEPSVIASCNPLQKYSLTIRREEVERTAVDQVHVLGQLALSGQLTLLYGRPSIGKSLITMSLIGEAAEQGRVDPGRCYYLDFDTDANGLLQKIDFAKSCGFHILSDNYLGFSSRQFLRELDDLIRADQAMGVVVVLDTLKQHVSLMDKQESSSFAARLRRFSKAGGTCIALGHCNKHPGPDGRLIYSGTTDLVEQFDVAYILSEASVDPKTQTRTVLLENFKSRGAVARRASYRYSIAEGLTYRELLESVTPIDETELSHVELAARIRTDTPLIDAITGCIADGIVAKMALVAAAVERSGASQRKVLDVLDRYTGRDPSVHRWVYTVHARGEKRYALLKSSC